MTASAWTDDRIERLKTLWREGRTAEQIAAELQNGITRSAVLGKVHRMGLSIGRPERPIVRKAAVERPSPVQQDGQDQGRGEGTDQARRRACVDLPSGGFSILTVRSGQCRWPYGDPRTGVSFCGRPVARGAFCSGHAEVGYRTPPGGLPSLLALAGLA